MNETGRVEAFSDGVFAVAITLLILDIKVPDVQGSQSLWHALGSQWTSYAAYVVTFLVVGVMWANHHQVFTYIKTFDRPLIFLNLVLLLVIAAFPWSAGLMAHYLNHDDADAHAAAAVYSLFMVAHALTFQLFWWYVTRTGDLFHPTVDRESARSTRKRFALGTLAYPLTVGLAFVSAPLTLAVHGLLAVYYAFNQVPIATTDDPQPLSP